MLLLLHSNLERIFYPNYMIIEPVRVGHLEGLWDDSNTIPPTI